jgi:two-component system OmpR family response regulator
VDAPNVLLIEDDPRVAEAVGCALEGEAGSFCWESDGTVGLSRAAAGMFDVIILDRMLPGLDGMAILQRLREAGVNSPVLMLSALGRSDHRVEGLDGGADDYLAKPFEPTELIARVRALRRRAMNRMSPAVIMFGDLECHVKARTVHRQGRHVPLSPKEFKLFKFLIDQGGEMVTREMLLREVWNLSFDPQTNVVDVNVGRLRRKLEEGFDTPCLETVRGSGFRLVAPKAAD